MEENRQGCVICGKDCASDWGWLLFEFWSVPRPVFQQLEAVVANVEKKPLCREHLSWFIQINKDFLEAKGDIPAFLEKVRGRIE